MSTSFFFFKILFIYFSERGREGEREGAKHQCVVASCVLPTEDMAYNPGMCPRLGIEPVTLWFTGQHSTTEPHQAGLCVQLLINSLTSLFESGFVFSRNFFPMIGEVAMAVMCIPFYQTGTDGVFFWVQVKNYSVKCSGW